MRSISTDLLAGVLVGVVLVPTAMAYGVIAGLGPVAGLHGAIVLGLLAAIMGNTRGLISGPNIFVTIVLASVVSEHGVEAGFTAALVSGVFLMVFGFTRLGRFVVYIPHSLLSGFFTAAGMVLVVTQVLPAIGLPPASGGVVGSVRAWSSATVDFDALAVAVVTVAVGVFWPARLSRYAPGQFVALLVGSAAGIIWFTGAPVIGEVPRGLPTLIWPAFEPQVIPSAFTMALLCSAVTLLTCLQADATTGGRHQPNRELVAQGVGNVVAGLIGGNPGGVSSITFLNLQSGGRGKIAGVTSAVVVALALMVPFNRVPLSMLAGIIMVTGYRLVDWEFLRRVRRIPVGYTVVMLVTAAVALLIDFTMAILAGLVLSTLVDATQSHRRELERLVSVPLLDTEIWPDSDPYQARVGLIVMPDRVSVASARELARILGGAIQASRATIMDFSRTDYLDDTAASLIGKVIDRKPVVVSGLHGQPGTMLTAFGTLRPDNRAQDLESAKARVRVMVESEGD